MTAERVERFLVDLERDPSAANRERWKDALEDLRLCIRQARAQGAEAGEIRAATGGQAAGRFLRPAVVDVRAEARFGATA